MTLLITRGPRRVLQACAQQGKKKKYLACNININHRGQRTFLLVIRLGLDLLRCEDNAGAQDFP